MNDKALIGRNCIIELNGERIVCDDPDFSYKENPWQLNIGDWAKPKCVATFNASFNDAEMLKEFYGFGPDRYHFCLDAEDIAYEIDAIFTSISEDGLTFTIQGDSVKRTYRTISKQFKMHPQGRNPILWTIDRMFN